MDIRTLTKESNKQNYLLLTKYATCKIKILTKETRRNYEMRNNKDSNIKMIGNEIR